MLLYASWFYFTFQLFCRLETVEIFGLINFPIRNGTCCNSWIKFTSLEKIPWALNSRSSRVIGNLTWCTRILFDLYKILGKNWLASRSLRIILFQFLKISFCLEPSCWSATNGFDSNWSWRMMFISFCPNHMSFGKKNILQLSGIATALESGCCFDDDGRVGLFQCFYLFNECRNI